MHWQLFISFISGVQFGTAPAAAPATQAFGFAGATTNQFGAAAAAPAFGTGFGAAGATFGTAGATFGTAGATFGTAATGAAAPTTGGFGAFTGLGTAFGTGTTTAFGAAPPLTAFTPAAVYQPQASEPDKFSGQSQFIDIKIAYAPKVNSRFEPPELGVDGKEEPSERNRNCSFGFINYEARVAERLSERPDDCPENKWERVR